MAKRKFRHVIVAGIDGAGSFALQAETPNMDSIFKNGAKTFRALASNPTVSGECWGSMFTGTAPDVHKMTNSIVSSVEYDLDSPYPSVFRRIKEAYPQVKMASFCNWSPINFGMVEHNLGVDFDTGKDDELAAGIAEYIKANKPDFMFIQFDSVDGAGHSSGYGSPGHLAQISVVDGYVGGIYNAVTDAGMADDTLFIAIADHGGTPDTGGGRHGGWTDAEKTVFFQAAGKGVCTGEIPQMNIRDLAAVILYAFGIDIPAITPGGLDGENTGKFVRQPMR